MKTLSQVKIEELLSKYEELLTSDASPNIIQRELYDVISGSFERKAILGFDVYRYSQFPLIEQSLIPYIFKELYDLTIANCLEYEPIIFQNLKKSDFTNNFIDIGDGGFQIFDTPFHAIVFAIFFQANIKRFNSGESIYIPLSKLLGEITLRYSLTYDLIYPYRNNYYGPAIINNSRIISKDKLNRFLLDENSYRWFLKNLNGVENLLAIDFDDFKYFKFFKGYKNWQELSSGAKKGTTGTLLFNKSTFHWARILKVDLLKIGEIHSKLDRFSIYSLHIQTLMYSMFGEFAKFTISLGNLNSSGIADQ